VRQGGFIARYSSPVTPSLRHFITSSLRHFLNGDGGIGPRFPVFGPRWREGRYGSEAGGLYCSLLVTRYSVTSSLHHFVTPSLSEWGWGIGPRFPVFGPRWREGARGKGRKAIGQ
jgi:hypothetical protein